MNGHKLWSPSETDFIGSPETHHNGHVMNSLPSRREEHHLQTCYSYSNKTCPIPSLPGKWFLPNVIGMSAPTSSHFQATAEGNILQT